jgi:hypothetical protein
VGKARAVAKGGQALNPTSREPCRNGTFARWTAPAALLLLFLALPVHSDEPNPDSKPELFRVGFTRAAFRNINQNDAAAAFRVLSEADGRRFGYVIKTETQVFKDDPTFEAAIKRGSLSLIIMTSWQFLTMDVHQHLNPLLGF